MKSGNEKYVGIQLSPRKFTFREITFQNIKTAKYWNSDLLDMLYFFWFSSFILKKFNDTFSCDCFILGSKRYEVYHKRKAEICGGVQADMVSWRKSSIPHGHNPSVLCPEFCLDWDVTVEEKCELARHNRN